MHAQEQDWRAEAIKMGKDGVRPVEIARRLDKDKDVIWNLMSYARRRGEDIPRWQRPTGKGAKMAVRMAPETRKYLQRTARARGRSLSALAADLLETIARDDMVDAVVDDGGANA